MATKKKAGKSKVRVNQLKVKKQKAADVTDKEAKRVRGGLADQALQRGPRRYA